MQFNLWDALIKAFSETSYMVGISLIVAIIFGGALGLLLYLTTSDFFYKNRMVNEVVGFIVNVIRSIPFIILLVLLIPFTKMMIGTSIGAKSVVIPLAIAAIAFYARIAEGAFSNVDKGVIEAAKACGGKNFNIIIDILIPEALPQLFTGITVTAISLIGYSAMAGTVGGGGIGDLAVRYGYQRYQTDVMFLCVVLLVIVVQMLQVIGDQAVKKVKK